MQMCVHNKEPCICRQRDSKFWDIGYLLLLCWFMSNKKGPSQPAIIIAIKSFFSSPLATITLYHIEHYGEVQTKG